MINQNVGSKIFKFRGLVGIRENHENLPYGISVKQFSCKTSSKKGALRYNLLYAPLENKRTLQDYVSRGAYKRVGYPRHR